MATAAAPLRLLGLEKVFQAPQLLCTVGPRNPHSEVLIHIMLNREPSDRKLFMVFETEEQMAEYCQNRQPSIPPLEAVELVDNPKLPSHIACELMLRPEPERGSTRFIPRWAIAVGNFRDLTWESCESNAQALRQIFCEDFMPQVAQGMLPWRTPDNFHRLYGEQPSALALVDEIEEALAGENDDEDE